MADVAAAGPRRQGEPTPDPGEGPADGRGRAGRRPSDDPTVRRNERAVGLILVALIVVAVILTLPDSRVVATDRRASTTRTSPSGTGALYLALEELGVPVARRLTPLVDAEPLPEALAVVAPVEPLSPREVGALAGRVRAGGTLLWVPGRDDAMLDTLGLRTLGWWDLVAEDDDATFRQAMEAADAAARGGGPAPPGFWRVEVRDHPWTSGVVAVEGLGRAFVAVDSAPGVPGALDRARPLVTVGDSLVAAAVLPLGEGRVVAVSDAGPLTNRWVRDGGLAPVVVRLGREVAAAGDILVFDEYHHGFRGGSLSAGLTAFLSRHPAGHGLLQVAAVLLLALWAAGRRFGSPRPAPPGRRSPLEHVDALARAYQESGARRLPRLLVLSALARHARRPRPRDEAEARALLDRLRGTAPRAGEALDRLEAALDGDDGDLLAVSAAVDRVTEELRR